MPYDFRLSVVSPDRTVVDEVTTSVVAPGVEGYFGVLANHEPMITELTTGIVTFRRTDLAEEYVAISGGFMEISGNRAIVLADSAEKESEIDIERARQAAERARTRLTGHTADTDTLRAGASLRRAVNRLKAKGQS